MLLWGLTPTVVLAEGRPVPDDGGPTELRFAVGVLDVDEINDANQNFTVNVFALVRWDDPRQAHSGSGIVSKPLSEVWSPKLIFLNRQKIWSSLGDTVEISPEGEVTLRQQFWGDFSQPLNLRNFPFDTQTFAIQIVSAGAEQMGDLNFVNDSALESFVTDAYSVADWKIVGHETDTSELRLRNGVSTHSFVLRFTAERLSNHYMVKVIAPLLMIVLLSWVVFWLNPSEGGSQLGVAVTSFLTMIAYHVALNSKLPEISYLTRLDLFVFSGTILVFLAMIEVVVTTGLAQKGKIELAYSLDRVCRFIFPVLLGLGACYAFLWS